MSELIYTILSQHTSDVNSERAFGRLRDRFPEWESVESVPVAEVEDAISVGGLARVKAPRIQAVLRQVFERRGDYSLDFLAQTAPADAKAWLCTLPGVGPKTAACVLCFSLGMPVLPVDTHVYRVAKRLALIGPKATADQAHELLEARLTPESIYPFHMDLIQHGRQICKARTPCCAACLLVERCPGRRLPNGSEIGTK